MACNLGFKRISYGLFTFAIFTDMQLSIDRALQKLNSNFLQLLDSKLNLNQNLSKFKSRLNVLIMICQQVQIKILIH